MGFNEQHKQFNVIVGDMSNEEQKSELLLEIEEQKALVAALAERNKLHADATLKDEALIDPEAILKDAVEYSAAVKRLLDLRDRARTLLRTDL
jgi:hypothetical protein